MGGMTPLGVVYYDYISEKTLHCIIHYTGIHGRIILRCSQYYEKQYRIAI